MESLPAGALRQSAIEAYADAANRWTPDLAAKQSMNLTDEAVRDQKVEAAVRRWLEVDAAAARRWIKSSDLPPQMKAQYSLLVGQPPIG